MNWKIFFFSSTLFFFLACGASDDMSGFQPNLGDAPTNPNEQVLTNLVNDIRQAGETCSGTPFAATTALIFNETLNVIAQKHAEYMNDIDDLTHIGANGASMIDRLIADNYNYSVAAENIAKGYADEISVIDAWQKSGGHCENIMNPNVTEMGIGTSGAYWVMIYATEE